MMKCDFIELSSTEAQQVGEQLKSCLEGGVGVTNLLAIYSLMWICWHEAGGCDHSVGICWCETTRAMDMLARKLGWPWDEYSSVLPEPKKLREVSRTRFLFTDMCGV